MFGLYSISLVALRRLAFILLTIAAITLIMSGLILFIEIPWTPEVNIVLVVVMLVSLFAGSYVTYVYHRRDTYEKGVK